MLRLHVRFKGVATGDIYHLVFHTADVMQEVFQQRALSRNSLESPLRCSGCKILESRPGSQGQHFTLHAHTIPDPSCPAALLVEMDHCPWRCRFINRPHAQNWDIGTGQLRELFGLLIICHPWSFKLALNRICKTLSWVLGESAVQCQAHSSH